VSPPRLSRAVSANSGAATVLFHDAKLSGQLSNYIGKAVLPIAAKLCVGLKDRESTIPSAHSLSLQEERAGHITPRKI